MAHPTPAARPAGTTVPESDGQDACEVFVADPARVAAVRAALVSPGLVSLLAETFRVLGDPTRVRVLDALSHAELCVCDLATLLGLSQSAVSHQLRVLRGLRLVRSRRDGRMVFYALDDDHITSLFGEGLRHVEEGRGQRGRP
ncbi:MAG TPA: metalloregulator ArsR/SmtB family transcription factor [Vicinamibacterales bacterium]|nr:metalloregulator ArsR/SmtB family transcription factor [Vicinamibacterales bacterium]